MERRGDRGAATRRQLVDTATRLFAEQGYEAVSIEAVLRECGVSRGALYHHFASKEALFTAALEAVEARVAKIVADAAADATNPLDGLRAASRAWLALAAKDAAIRRLVLIDAPSVVGWAAWREIDARYGLGLVKAALGLAAAAGRVREDRIDVYAHTLLAVLIEVAMLVARADDKAEATRAGEDAVEAMLSRIVGVEPGGSW